MINIDGKIDLKTITYPNGEIGITNFDVIKDYLFDYYRNGNKVILHNKDNTKDFIQINWTPEELYKEFTLIILLMKLIDRIETNYSDINDEYKCFEASYHLSLSYFPFSREDKEENGRANMFEAILMVLYKSFDKINIPVIHADTSKYILSDEKINITKSVFESRFIEWNSLYKGQPLYCFPDESAFKRFSYLLPEGEYYVVLSKKRDKNTGQLTGAYISSTNFFNSNVVIDNIILIDDTCTYGGTFSLAIETLKQEGLVAKNNNVLMTYYDEGLEKKFAPEHNIIHHYAVKTNFN